MSKRAALEQLEREDLEEAARDAGVARPEVLTRDEILDAIEALDERAAGSREGSKGFLGRMRQVLAAFVEKGLNLPEAAERIRAGTAPPAEPALLPTVTLAEIYAAQGHTDRALAVLDQILRTEPEHPGALRLRARLRGQPSPIPEDDEDDEDETPAQTPPGAINAPSSVILASPPAKPTPPPAPPALAAPEAVAPSGPPRPAPMLDEEPLPDTYDVDEVVLMPVDPTTLYLYWELRPGTLQEALLLDPTGQLVLRIDQILGADYQTLRLLPAAALGDVQVDDLPPGALCVAVLGLRSESQWIPLLRSTPRALPPAASVVEVAHQLVRWTETTAVAPPPEPTPALVLAIALRGPFDAPLSPSPAAPPLATAAPATPAAPAAPFVDLAAHLPSALSALLPEAPDRAPSSLLAHPPLGSSERWAFPPEWSPHAPGALGASERWILSLREPLPGNPGA
jgi:hypothetical protein